MQLFNGLCNDQKQCNIARARSSTGKILLGLSLSLAGACSSGPQHIREIQEFDYSKVTIAEKVYCTEYNAEITKRMQDKMDKIKQDLFYLNASVNPTNVEPTDSK